MLRQEAQRLRVALISLMEAVSDDAQASALGLRGYLPIGGRSIVRHQLGLGLAFGCARVVVLAEALTGELVALQHVAEAGGARFHVIATARALVPLVAPEDELLVFSDGLLAMPEDALRLLGDGPALLTLPVEAGLAAGFERIDLNNANAGAMCLPGRLVAGLGDLPAEWNPVSALLRLATQARVSMKALPATLLDEGRWRLIRNEHEAHRAEPGWLHLHTRSTHVRSPGEWISAMAVQKLGSALLHAGTRPWLVALAALLLGLLGLGSGWLGWQTAGFAILGCSWIFQQTAMLLARIERDSLLSPTGRVPASAFAGAGLDVAFVALAAWRSGAPVIPGLSWGSAWFAPAVLFLLLRLLPRVLPARLWTWWLGDRFVAGMALMAISAVLPFEPSLQILVLCLVGSALVVSGRRGNAPNPVLTTRA